MEERVMTAAPTTCIERLSNSPEEYLSAAVIATEASNVCSNDTPARGKRIEKERPVIEDTRRQVKLPTQVLPREDPCPPHAVPIIDAQGSHSVAMAVTAGPAPPGARDASAAPQK